ncbi:hypothetical protein THICB3330035 [Thiomonas sp. CB3]|nr:hypothetical protein THICB3330035 [Thiomonas sp. CB3]
MGRARLLLLHAVGEAGRGMMSFPAIPLDFFPLSALLWCQPRQRRRPISHTGDPAR